MRSSLNFMRPLCLCQDSRSEGGELRSAGCFSFSL